MGRLKIIFPSGNELQAIAEDFASKGTLRGCCGSIDVSHILIKAPKNNAKDFYCRKSFHSIVLQGVADASLSFMNITVGWPGSVHNARVLRTSKLYRAGVEGKLFLPQTVLLQNEPVRLFLVGDKAYPALPCLKKLYG